MGYIERVKIKNFQSIEELDIEFSPGLTTIVGPSSSGKSATLRALKTLVHNTSRPQVRVGASALEVTARVGGHDVGVVRGKSKSAYTLDGESYTKAGTSTPEPVAGALRLAGVEPDVHFSFQFDKPYLLAETGSTVSAVLAKLTQANVLREAVREGSRLAQQHTATGKGRRADVEQLATRLKTEFADLPTRQHAVGVAQERIGQAEKFFSESKSLSDLLEARRTITNRVVLLSAARRVDAHEKIAAAEDALQSARDVESMVREVLDLRSRVESAETNVGIKRGTVDALQEKYAVLLHEVGVCPTCGQSTT